MNYKKIVIGDATLYLGDCIEVMADIPSKSIDVCVTDPPYGHNNNNGDLISNIEKALGRKSVVEAPPRPIANDGPEANPLFRSAIKEIDRLLSAGGCCCCCCGGGGGPDPQFARWSLWLDEVLDFKQMVVWDKGPMGLGWHYRRSYETILVAQKRGSACRWYDKSGAVENVIRPFGKIRKIIPTADDHPTPKPVELAEHFLRLHATAGQTAIDPFMGRGWVGLAALKLGMKFIGVEIDLEHFDIACKKIEAIQDQGLFCNENKVQSQEYLFATESTT